MAYQDGSNSPLTAFELAKEFTALLRSDDLLGAAAKFNHDSIVSIEPFDGPKALCCGKDAVRRKGECWQRWLRNNVIDSRCVDGPYVNGSQFVVRFKIDLTSRRTGKRISIDEIGLYVVADGKIVAETFCYLAE